jgi:hypothetical protein
MKFERGKNIKETLRIGKAANPIRMRHIEITSPYRGKEYLQHSYHVMGDQAKGILECCKHSIPDLRTDIDTEAGPYEISIAPLPGEDRLNVNGTRIEELRGEYIEYGGEIYPILFPMEINMEITINK